VEDQARAADFYEKVFGWDIQQWEGAPYWLATTGPDTEAGINGALGLKSKDFAVPVFVIEVPDIEAAIKSVEEAGAAIVHPKSPVPGAGYSAYFTDTEGNRMGLFETDESAVIE
jgi:predicted enzyme related to lactoylglutathione lyase